MVGWLSYAGIVYLAVGRLCWQERFRRGRKISKSEKLRQVCLPVRPHGKLGSHWTDFHEILYLNIFKKSVEKIKVSFMARITGTFREERCTFITV